jgi:hypothetical protein
MAFQPPAFLAAAPPASLPIKTVFQGEQKFGQLLKQAPRWKSLPLGDRIAAVGLALCGTPYKGSTLEIDDHIEAPSVNLNGLDCWTFFETSLAFARMLEEPSENWTPKTLLRYIEVDRYRGGKCDGSYLSRLHYLEEWILDNAERGWVANLTRSLGGQRVQHPATEMTIHWKSYRYMRANPAVRRGIEAMEERVARLPMEHIPKSDVAAIEPRLRSGDILCITTHDSGGIGTSHVGLAYRAADGQLHFMHASAPRNHGKVLVDARLSRYLHSFSSIAGIMVARPLR